MHKASVWNPPAARLHATPYQNNRPLKHNTEYASHTAPFTASAAATTGTSSMATATIWNKAVDNIDEIVTRLDKQGAKYVHTEGHGEIDDRILDRAARDLLQQPATCVCVIHRYERGAVGKKRSRASDLYAVAMYIFNATK